MYVLPTIVGQASVKFKKRPLKEKENQNVNTGSTSVTGTAHNANVSRPVSVGVSRHFPNNADSAESFNEGNVALLNNREEPVSLELQPAPVATQQQDPELDAIPITTPSQDTSCHTTLDDAFQHDNSSGQILQSLSFSQLEIEAKKTIANFNAEFSADLYQQQSNLPEDSPPHLIPVCCNLPIINPIQESRGQWDMTKLTSIHQLPVKINSLCFQSDMCNT